MRKRRTFFTEISRSSREASLARTPWAKLKAIAAGKEFCVRIDLSLGEFSHTVWTTDLTEEYVRFNLGE